MNTQYLTRKHVLRVKEDFLSYTGEGRKIFYDKNNKGYKIGLQRRSRMITEVRLLLRVNRKPMRVCIYSCL